jgi:hypothetical protein
MKTRTMTNTTTTKGKANLRRRREKLREHKLRTFTSKQLKQSLGVAISEGVVNE